MANIQKYLLIDFRKFHDDIFESNSKMKDRISVAERLVKNGMSDSVITNTSRNAIRGTGKFDYSLYEKCDEFGVIQPIYFNTICNVFNLDRERYILKLKSNEVKEEVTTPVAPEVDLSEVLTKLDDLIVTINKLGNICMQSLEYQKNSCDQLKTLNDKYNKPSAYIKK